MNRKVAMWLLVWSCACAAGCGGSRPTARATGGSATAPPRMAGPGRTCSSRASAPVSTAAPVVAAARAAEAFRASLDDAQRAQASFCLEDTELYAWSNLPANLAPREGLPLASLRGAQLTLAWRMLDAFLSTSGYRRARFIVDALDPFLLAQTDRPEMFGAGLYRLSLFNRPGDGAWGVQVDGHHLAITFVVEGDEVRMTPAFFGADPRVYEGVRTFAAEEAAAFELIASFTRAELAAAVIAELAPEDVLTAPGDSGLDAARAYDYTGFAGAGLSYAAMTTSARARLRALVAAALAYQDDPWLTARLGELDAAVAELRFAWMGPPSSTVPGTRDRFYFRVFSRAILIEFDLTDADHAHMVVRSPDDDLGSLGFHVPTLLEHLRQAPHDADTDGDRHARAQRDDAAPEPRRTAVTARLRGALAAPPRPRPSAAASAGPSPHPVR